MLTNVRALTARQGRSLEAARTRLWACELSLLLPRHPLELRRERGELLVRLGSHLEGAAELEEFASLVDDADEEVGRDGPPAGAPGARPAQLTRPTRQVRVCAIPPRGPPARGAPPSASRRRDAARRVVADLLRRTGASGLRVRVTSDGPAPSWLSQANVHPPVDGAPVGLHWPEGARGGAGRRLLARSGCS